MAIRLVNRGERLFDVLLLCMGRDAFVRDVAANLEQRGYVVFVGECQTLDGVQRAAKLSYAISRSGLSAAFVGPQFLKTAWTASELEEFEQVEVRILRGAARADLGMISPATMVFDSSEGVAVIASKLSRSCGQPGSVALPPSAASLCWRCGTLDTNGYQTARARACARCADEEWRGDPESLYDPDPLGMGLIPSIDCTQCRAPLDPSIRFRNRDVTGDGGAMKIQGIACTCGCQQFAITWSGGSSAEEW